MSKNRIGDAESYKDFIQEKLTDAIEGSSMSVKQANIFIAKGVEYFEQSLESICGDKKFQNVNPKVVEEFLEREIQGFVDNAEVIHVSKRHGLTRKKKADEVKTWEAREALFEFQPGDSFLKDQFKGYMKIQKKLDKGKNPDYRYSDKEAKKDIKKLDKDFLEKIGQDLHDCGVVDHHYRDCRIGFQKIGLPPPVPEGCIVDDQEQSLGR